MKQISFLIICLLFTLNAWCQLTALQDKITLKTGDVYVGEIVVKTDDLIMIKTKDGSKFQFQVSEISKIEEALLSLWGKIDELKYIEVGVNYDLAAKSFDICLISHFESVDQLDAYRIHPEHLKVAKLIGQHAVERAAVDYEF